MYPYGIVLLAASVNLKEGYSPSGSIFKLVGLIILCILIIVASYYTTKFIGSKGRVGTRSSSIVPLEAVKIAPNKYLQLVKIGNRYFVIAVSKDSISLITEVSEDEIPAKTPVTENKSFKDIFSTIINRGNKKDEGSEE